MAYFIRYVSGQYYSIIYLDTSFLYNFMAILYTFILFPFSDRKLLKEWDQVFHFISILQLEEPISSQSSRITLFLTVLREISHIFELNICDSLTPKIRLLPFTNADLGFPPLKDILDQHSSTFSLVTLTHVWQNFYNPRQKKHIRTM